MCIKYYILPESGIRIIATISLYSLTNTHCINWIICSLHTGTGMGGGFGGFSSSFMMDPFGNTRESSGRAGGGGMMDPFGGGNDFFGGGGGGG